MILEEELFILKLPRRMCDSHMTVQSYKESDATEQARAQHRVAELLGDGRSCSP